VSDEAQDLAEAGHGQETAVLRICNLPYLTQDRDLACDYAELLGIGLLEEILEHALLVGREVEDGLACAWLARVSTAGTRCSNTLNSPLAEGSAMAVGLAMPGRVVVMVDAGCEAEAPSCRAIARGSCVFPAGGREKVGGLAAARQQQQQRQRQRQRQRQQQQQQRQQQQQTTNNHNSRRRMEIVMGMRTDSQQ
jgi:hypothetical protein